MGQSSKTDDELILEWTEERLLGVWETCLACESGNVQRCETCNNLGECPREDYLRAEMALTDALFVQLGVELMVTCRASVNRALLLDVTITLPPVPDHIPLGFDPFDP